uniref:DUF1336 domain-containing protein n=1 Tax=Steinernema glaseri TaxID=37863 RepID=A0A1I8A1R6_9BILA
MDESDSTDIDEYQLLRRPKSLPDFSDVEPGLNARWKCRYFVYKHEKDFMPKANCDVTVEVRFSTMILRGVLPKTKLKVPLVSMGYIESIERRRALDVRGVNFRLLMCGIEDLEETRDRLRFLVVRQRVPHCILKLPLVWKKGDEFQADGSDDCMDIRCFPFWCCFCVQRPLE